MSCFKPSPYFFLPVILVQVDLNLSHLENIFPEAVWLFSCFWLSLIWPCLHLVVNPLYLLSCSLLLIVDFDSDTCGECYYLPWEDSLIIHHFWPPWTSRPFYVAELTSAFFFLRIYQTVDLATPNVPAIYLLDFLLFFNPYNCLFHLHGEHL